MRSSYQKKLSAGLLGILLCAGSVFPAMAAGSKIVSGNNETVTGGEIFDYLKNLGLVDTTGTGTGSIAVGPNAKASSVDSSAYGNGAEALGWGTVAIGNQAHAGANYSIAIGQLSDAGGDDAIAIGDWTMAHGLQSIALGAQTSAFGELGIAVGYNASAIGTYSAALGNFATASKDYGLAIGYGAFANRYEVSFGHSIGDYYYTGTGGSNQTYTVTSGFSPQIKNAAGDSITDSNGNALSFAENWGNTLVVPAGETYTVTYQDGKTITLSEHDALTYEKDSGGTGYFQVAKAKKWTWEENVRLTHVDNPKNSTDAANKKYVDTVTVLYDKAKDEKGNESVNYNSVTFSGTNGTQLKNVAKGTDETDAVNVKQLNDALQNFSGLQGKIEVAAGDHVTVSTDTTTTAGTTTYKIRVSADGTVSKGNTGIVTGGTVYEAIQNISSAAAEGLKKQSRRGRSQCHECLAVGGKTWHGKNRSG